MKLSGIMPVLEKALRDTSGEQRSWPRLGNGMGNSQNSIAIGFPFLSLFEVQWRQTRVRFCFLTDAYHSLGQLRRLRSCLFFPRIFAVTQKGQRSLHPGGLY
jgi:hypothetical protein